MHSQILVTIRSVCLIRRIALSDIFFVYGRHLLEVGYKFCSFCLLLKGLLRTPYRRVHFLVIMWVLRMHEMHEMKPVVLDTVSQTPKLI